MNEAVKQKLTDLYAGTIPGYALAFFEIGGRACDCIPFVNRCRSAEKHYAEQADLLRYAKARARAAADLFRLYTCMLAGERPTAELAAAFGVDDPLDLLPERMRVGIFAMEKMKGRPVEPVPAPMAVEPNRFRTMPVGNLLRLVYLGGVPLEVSAIFRNGDLDAMWAGLELLQQRQRAVGEDCALDELVLRARHRIAERTNRGGPPRPLRRAYRVKR